jgi:hypothetical protein
MGFAPEKRPSSELRVLMVHALLQGRVGIALRLGSGKALADKGRGREHDNPRDEYGHA